MDKASLMILDADGDGIIDEDEAKKALEILDSDGDGILDADELAGLLDADGDGTVSDAVIRPNT